MLKKAFILGLLVTPMVVQSAQAGLINYERRNKSQQNKSTVSSPAKRAVPAATKAAVPTPPPAARPAEIAKEPFKIQNSAERKYDANKDGFLQETERQRFLKDVVAAIEERGEFFVNSELVKTFDSDKDGEISLKEARAIQQSLN